VIAVFTQREAAAGHGGLGRRRRAHLEQLLRTREDELVGELRSLDSRTEPTGEPASVAAGSREVIRRRFEDAMAAIRAALARLEKGEYGACTSCRQAIGYRRLVMIPEAELCARCQWEAERTRKRDTGCGKR
jgi:RNA polymerase-binding transcription factor DksA